MTTRDDKLNSAHLTPSICEDALEEYRAANDTLAGLIERSHLDVREFMMLSFVCDQGTMAVESILSALGLGMASTMSCLERLRDIEMVTCQFDECSGVITGEIAPTALGRAIARRIHAGISA